MKQRSQKTRFSDALPPCGARDLNGGTAVYFRATEATRCTHQNERDRRIDTRMKNDVQETISSKKKKLSATFVHLIRMLESGFLFKYKRSVCHAIFRIYFLPKLVRTSMGLCLLLAACLPCIAFC